MADRRVPGRRRRHVPGRPLSDLLAGLPEDGRLALLNHAGFGLSDAALAVGAIVGGGRRRGDTVPQLLADLSDAIREFEAVRAIVAAAAEGGGAVG
jgi:hypothetical protein